MSGGVPTVVPEHMKTFDLVPIGSRARLKAFYDKRDSHVFIKFFSSTEQNERSLGEILKEVELMHQINHPRLAPIVGIYRTPNLFGILTEWRANGPLDSLIHERNVYPDLPPCLCVSILADIAEGLCHLHSLCPPVPHPALKPSKILLDDHYRAKVTEFGMSKLRTLTSIYSNRTDQSDQVYLSPERLQGSDPTLADDVYSLGVIAWELLCRIRPFHERDKCLKLETFITRGLRPQPSVEVFLKAKDIDPTLIVGLDQLINRCWHQNPFVRPTMAECFYLLSNILQKFPREQTDSCHWALVRSKRADETTRGVMQIPIQNLDTSYTRRESNNSPWRNRSMSTPETVQPPQCPKPRSVSLPVTPKMSSSMPPMGASRSGCQGGSWQVGRSLSNGVSWLPGGESQPLPSVGHSPSSSLILMRCREPILQKMTEGSLNRLLDTMLSRCLFSKDEYENINANATLKARARACLDTAHEKGEDAARMVLQTVGYNGFANGHFRNPA
ncbi:receptor-interacting serine/threonine-protein kinase 2-like isoform 2-T35 [Discoglossus pictus]